MTKNIETPDWSYDGEYGPEKWHELYPVACSGERQSPVELGGASVAPLAPLCLDYKGTSFKAVRGFYTLNIFPVSDGAEASLLIDGIECKLEHIHFHTPAEHTVREGIYPMEMHLVHITPGGSMAVLAVFIEEGERNEQLESLWRDIPSATGGERSGLVLDIEKILPTGQLYYTYEGSLTIPPCTEGVKWIVLKDTVNVSAEALRAYKAVFPPNARPVCPLSGRSVLVSG